MKLRLPRSLVGRMALLLGIALFVAQLANLALILNERQKLDLAQNEGPAITRFANAAADVNQANAAFRSALIADLSNRGARFVLATKSAVAAVDRDREIETTLSDGLRRAGLPDQPVRATSSRQIRDADGLPQPRELHALTLETRLPDGQWLSATLRTPPRDPWLAGRLAVATLFLYAIVLSVTVLIARRLAHPLLDLKRAAEQFRGRAQPINVEARGPDDLRNAIEAFNDMNRRLIDLLDEKDRMLGAIGHDLRTPLASLRIRVESMDPPAERDAAIRKIQEMTSTLEDMLVLARSGRQREAARPTNITSLIETVVEEFQDLGASATLISTEKVVANVQANLLRRAVRNLIDNAVKYGETATVSLVDRPNEILIRVEDTGPGIPEEYLARVLEPFYRLEESRNRDTGGSGLGLAITTAIVESHGGKLTMDNIVGGGVAASISIPRI